MSVGFQLLGCNWVPTRECWRVNEFVANTSSSESQHVGWVPTVALEKKKYVEKDHENLAERALRAKKSEPRKNVCTKAEFQSQK